MKFYLDTSVFGGFFDKEFDNDTAKLFEYIKKSKSEIIYSNVTLKELENSPTKVKNLIKDLEEEEKISMTCIIIDDEAEKLAQTYINEGALTKKCEEDARHIAIASVHGEVNILVSWNFKHMVNLTRMQKYNSINIRLGYKSIEIRNPKDISIQEDIIIQE